jgi:putative ABC transport system permease protein
MRSRRWTGGLVVVQLALTLVLLTGAGLMMRNVMAQTRVDAGIATDDLVMMRLTLPDQKYPSAEQRRAFYRQLDDQIATLPAMRAGVGTWAPLRGAFARPVSIEGRPAASADERPRVSSVMIGTGYLDALGVRPARGRAFAQSDGGPGQPAAIVNERFAAVHFPNESALGRRIELDAAGSDVPASGWLTIIGVVPNVRHEEADVRIVEPVVYLPLASAPLPFATIVVRSALDIATVVTVLRDAVGAVDADLPVFDAMTLRDNVALDLLPFRVFGSLFGIFALAALALAAVGIYGVTAYSVAQRTREIGVRVALGARTSNVWWLVTRRAAIQLGVGLLFGTAGALGMGQVLQSVLFSVSGRDPVTLIAVAALLVMTALAACVGPARRATRLDPVAALRAE